jgi:hypothetical protein
MLQRNGRRRRYEGKKKRKKSRERKERKIREVRQKVDAYFQTKFDNITSRILTYEIWCKDK